MTLERYGLVDLAGADEPVETALAELNATHAVERLWQRDPTLWKPRPADNVELGERLGWLTLPDDLLPQVGDLRDFADEIAAGGIRYLVVCRGLRVAGVDLGSDAPSGLEHLVQITEKI